MSDSDSSGDGMGAAMRKYAKAKASQERIRAAMKAATEAARPPPAKDPIAVAPRDAVKALCGVEDYGKGMNWVDADRIPAWERPPRRLAYHAEVLEVIRKVGGIALNAGDTWLPIKDSTNEWCYVGSNDKSLLGKTHSEVEGKKPDWGMMSAPIYSRGFVLLKPASTPAPASAAAPAAVASAAQHAAATKPAAAAGAGPAGAPKPAAASGTVAAAAPAKAPTGAGAAAGGAGAAAGKPAAAASVAASVASGPALVDLGGATTWTAAKAAATQQGKRLATQAEVQAYIKSKGGKPLKTTDAWVPVNDAPQEWVSVGGQFPDRLGKTHTLVAGSKPSWSMEAGVKPWRGMVLMC